MLNNKIILVLLACFSLQTQAYKGEIYIKPMLKAVGGRQFKQRALVGGLVSLVAYALSRTPYGQQQLKAFKSWLRMRKPQAIYTAGRSPAQPAQRKDPVAGVESKTQENKEKNQKLGEQSVSVGVAEAQGRRAAMEDAYAINIQNDFSLFGLYDGHGGKQVADYAAEHLHGNVRNCYAKTGNMHEALRQGFLETHESWKKIRANHGGVSDPGSTAVVAAIQGNKIFVANAGDSRAVLSRAGIAFALSEDHKPNRPDEKARIEKLGGKVIHYGASRVQGVLAVSRALGDMLLNPFVTPDPEIRHTVITAKDEFLLMACDGVWDVMDNQQAVYIVGSALRGGKNVHQAADMLKNEALKRRSADNITVMIIRLNHA